MTAVFTCAFCALEKEGGNPLPAQCACCGRTTYVVSESADLQPRATSDHALRALWRYAGGRLHGPNVETGTMPEAKLLPFLRHLVDDFGLKASTAALDGEFLAFIERVGEFRAERVRVGRSDGPIRWDIECGRATVRAPTRAEAIAKARSRA